MAKGACTACDGKDTCKDLDESGFSGAVGADNRDFVSAFEGEIEVFEDSEVAVAFGDAGEFENHTAGAFRSRKLERELSSFLINPNLLDFFQLANAALNLLGFGGFVAEAFDEAAGFFEFFLLVFGFFEKEFAFFSSFAFEEAVVPGVVADISMLDVEGAGGDGVEEGFVVAYDDEGTVVGFHEGLEPLQRFDVEMVGGFVEKEIGWAPQEEFGKGNAHEPASAKFGGGSGEVGGSEAEAAEDSFDVGLEGIVACVFEFRLDHAILVEQGIIGSILVSILVSILATRLVVPHLAKSGAELLFTLA